MIAVLSDVHGNLEALEAVLADARREPVDSMICLGDVVGYGADPNACMKRILEVTAGLVLGNHDVAACNLDAAESFNEVAREAIRWTAGTLTEENLETLRGLPFELTRDGARYVHASPDDPPAWHYILTEQEAWNAFAACEERVCFVGHSHVPLRVILREERLVVESEETLRVQDSERALINVGSVGQPRDGDWRASYALWDPATRGIIARRVEYDLVTAQRKILDAGLPEILARRLRVGQ